MARFGVMPHHEAVMALYGLVMTLHGDVMDL
jgi:hypothetical protein